MKKLQINEEFQSLISPLTKGEYDLLEQSILKEGIRDPIVVYGDTIVDGHNRYKIAQKHGLEFKTISREFDSIDKVEIWILENQAGRRNLNESQRALLGARLEKTTHGGDRKSKDHVANWQPNRKSISKMVNASPRSIGRAKKVLACADIEMIKGVENGELSLSAAEKEINKTEKIKKIEQKDIVENIIKDYTLIQMKTPPELYDLIVKHMENNKISDEGEGVIDFIRNLLNTVNSITEFLAKKL